MNATFPSTLPIVFLPSMFVTDEAEHAFRTRLGAVAGGGLEVAGHGHLGRQVDVPAGIDGKEDRRQSVAAGVPAATRPVGDERQAHQTFQRSRRLWTIRVGLP